MDIQIKLITNLLEWRPKCEHVGLMTHTSLKALLKEDWIFDNGCSRHMTGVNKFLDTVKPYTNNHVTFGNGTEEKILWIGNLNNDELPKLDNVMWVKGLTSILISISQLCEQGMDVNINKSECLVTNEKGEVLMRGIKTKENFNIFVPQGKS